MGGSLPEDFRSDRICPVSVILAGADGSEASRGIKFLEGSGYSVKRVGSYSQMEELLTPLKSRGPGCRVLDQINDLVELSRDEVWMSRFWGLKAIVVLSDLPGYDLNLRWPKRAAMLLYHAFKQMASVIYLGEAGQVLVDEALEALAWKVTKSEEVIVINRPAGAPIEWASVISLIRLPRSL